MQDLWLWQQLLHLRSTLWHLQRFVMQLPVQLHLKTPWPPPILSSRAADLRLISLSIGTSSIFMNFSNMGWNWFLLYHWSKTPDLHPSFHKWPPGWASSTIAFKFGYSHRPLSTSGIGTRTVSWTLASLTSWLIFQPSYQLVLAVFVSLPVSAILFPVLCYTTCIWN